MTELSILMPAYNEEATIELAIERVLEAPLGVESFELIVVENGSTDSTRSVLAGRQWPEQVRIVEVDRNKGKGDGVRHALAVASGTYSAILDADLEYDPADIAKLIEPLREGTADAVFGTRLFHAHSTFGFWYVLGGRAVNVAANALYNTWLSDLSSCHKAMATERMRSLRLREDGYTIEAEIGARLLRSGAVIYEVPVNYSARSREAGKKITVLDGLRMFWTLLRCRFR